MYSDIQLLSIAHGDFSNLRVLKLRWTTRHPLLGATPHLVERSCILTCSNALANSVTSQLSCFSTAAQSTGYGRCRGLVTGHAPESQQLALYKRSKVSSRTQSCISKCVFARAEVTLIEKAAW